MPVILDLRQPSCIFRGTEHSRHVIFFVCHKKIKASKAQHSETSHQTPTHIFLSSIPSSSHHWKHDTIITRHWNVYLSSSTYKSGEFDEIFFFLSLLSRLSLFCVSTNKKASDGSNSGSNTNSKAAKRSPFCCFPWVFIFHPIDNTLK